MCSYNFDSDCEGACTVMQRLSERVVGEPNELQEKFEELHFLLFAVSVVFIFVVVYFLRGALMYAGHHTELERAINEAQAHAKRMKRSNRRKNSPKKSPVKSWTSMQLGGGGRGEPSELALGPPQQALTGSSKKDTPPAVAPAAWEEGVYRASVAGRKAHNQREEDMMHLASPDSGVETDPNRALKELMAVVPRPPTGDAAKDHPHYHHLPEGAWWVNTLMEHWKKGKGVTKAEYVRLRHRFIDDEDEFVSMRIPHNFNFAQYLKLTLTQKYASIIEIAPVDWGILWVVMGIVFFFYYIDRDLALVLFFTGELAIYGLSLLVLDKVVKIRRALVPPATGAVHYTEGVAEDPKGGDRVSEAVLEPGRVECADCVSAEAVTHTCLTCGLHLCDACTSYHKRAKKTQQHVVKTGTVQLPAGGNDAEGAGADNRLSHKTGVRLAAPAYMSLPLVCAVHGPTPVLEGPLMLLQLSQS
jgi:hypothetical protein